MPPVIRRAINGLVLVALIAASASAYAYRRQRGFEVATSEGALINVSGLGAVPLRDLASGHEAYLTPENRHLLVVFLSAADCSSCLFQTAEWNRLVEARANVSLAAVIVRSSREEAAQYVHSFRPAFPVYFDDTGRLPAAIGLPKKTPLKVLLGASGRPVLAAESSTDDSKFVVQVMQIVGKRS